MRLDQMVQFEDSLQQLQGVKDQSVCFGGILTRCALIDQGMLPVTLGHSKIEDLLDGLPHALRVETPHEGL